MEKDQMKMAGSVHVILTGPDGRVKREHTEPNLIVSVGKTYLTTWLTAATQATAFMPYIGLGTGTTLAASGDLTLQTEMAGGGYARQVGVLSSLSNVWTNTAVFLPGVGTGAITEAGLFSAVTSGTLFARQVFAAYNKAAGDTITFVWSVTFS